MSNTSRRRLAMAAGALLAGAAIPIAAAGTAWADDAIAQAEAEVKIAAKADIPYEISINGVTHGTCTAADNCSANSGAPGEHNVAVAIGDNSNAYDANGDTHDTARATTGGTVDINYATGSTGVAANNGDAAINDNSTPATNDTSDHANANGTGSVADLELASGSSATAKGTNSAASVTAVANFDVTDSRATALNGAEAFVSNDGVGSVAVTHDVATANGVANATPTLAQVFDSMGSTATATDTGSAASAVTGVDGATVDGSVDSHAIAVHPDSGSEVAFSVGSSSVVNDGNQFILIEDHTHWVNGMP